MEKELELPDFSDLAFKKVWLQKKLPSKNGFTFSHKTKVLKAYNYLISEL